MRGVQLQVREVFQTGEERWGRIGGQKVTIEGHVFLFRKRL